MKPRDQEQQRIALICALGMAGCLLLLIACQLVMVTDYSLYKND